MTTLEVVRFSRSECVDEMVMRGYLEDTGRSEESRRGRI